MKKKKSKRILQFSSPFSPRPLLLPCPKCLLTEARKASSFSPVVVWLIILGHRLKCFYLLNRSTQWVGFAEYQHGGQHRIGQKRSYRFVAPYRPCHYMYKSPLFGYWQIKEREKYPTDGLQQGVLEKCNIQNFSKKALIAFSYCQEKPIHDNNTFIHVSWLPAPS